jgi:membrane protease YdiL (CAAX protease family)
MRPNLRGRAKALGLAVLYVAAAALLVAAFIFGLAKTGLVPAARGSSLSLSQEFLRESAYAVAAVLALLALARLIREPISRMGFARTGAGRDLLTGLVAGVVLVAVPLGIIWAMGACEFGGVALAPDRILSFAAYYVVLDFAVAVFEETLFRSVVLVQLSRAFSFWPAAIVTAVLFGLAHAVNINEAPLGLLVACLAGLVLAYSFWRSGALWFAVGFHTAYDFVEDFVFGVPDSGVVPENALLHTTLHGPDWLTGGKVGPEASLLAFAAFLVLALIARLALPRRDVSL